VSLPPPDPARLRKIAVVIVSYNTRERLLECLRSLPTGTPAVELVVVDNASADGSAAAVREALPQARVVEAGANLGFSRACNLGWRACRAPYVLFLNPDTVIRPGALEALASELDDHADVGIVGPRTVNPDGTAQVSTGPSLTPTAEWRQRRLVRGVDRRRPWALAEAESRSARRHEPDWVSGSCLLARRELLESLDGFDERFFLYEEDVDLCLRARQAGWRVVFTPEGTVVHHRGASMAKNAVEARLEYHRSHLLYYRKHLGPVRTASLRGYLVLLGIGARLLSLVLRGPVRRRRSGPPASP
jgi:GT2 family glycosyltransferase